MLKIAWLYIQNKYNNQYAIRVTSTGDLKVWRYITTFYNLYSQGFLYGTWGQHHRKPQTCSWRCRITEWHCVKNTKHIILKLVLLELLSIDPFHARHTRQLCHAHLIGGQLGLCVDAASPKMRTSLNNAQRQCSPIWCIQDYSDDDVGWIGSLQCYMVFKGKVYKFGI